MAENIPAMPQDRLTPRFPANLSAIGRRDVCRGLAGSALVAGPARAESWASGSNALHILVLKSARRLMLMRAGEAFHTFPISLGKNPTGPKRAEGDGRTPEGTYLIDFFNDQSRYYKALRISYPNAEDMRRAAAAGLPPGGNIEIHGMPPDLDDYNPKEFSRDWTDGCIAVSNRAMDTIWRTVALDTLVHIRP